MASNPGDKIDSLTPASSVASSPEVAAQNRQPKSEAPTTPPRLGIELSELFTENVVATIWRVAVRELAKQNPPTHYPEYITTSGPEATYYTLREAAFWTCGFFPGSMYALLERSMKYPQSLPLPSVFRPTFQAQLIKLCRDWVIPIRAMATRTDTHDMSFIIQPALRMDWELTGNTESLKNVITAAESLASRYDERVGAIRSWDQAVNKRYSFTDMEEDFLVIIDSMCNLDLLYYAGHQTGNQKLIDIATQHAHTVLKTIVRKDWSTYHLLNFSARTGAIKNQLTNQGYRDWSTWSRGQAWAILGFTQTYSWTRDPVFLDAAIQVSKYFIGRLETSEVESQRYVPLWDFDAPLETKPPRDSSAGMIAVNGFLLLHQILVSEHRSEEAKGFLDVAVRIIGETVELALSRDRAEFEVPGDVEGKGKEPVVRDGERGRHWDGILMHATANNNEDAIKRYWDHGLVYADYYFLEAGNKLLRMGLV
ncbi:glycoside hydrolase family 88 protein [Hyaloscypha variabilis F]|uniref:Glycoside hydrolase family 88 protein n=1 Tax=Hyaloscypha variabilis (strain UAMH 11265 / GT02V1 / F) TaxID=1149755 RepID=A0A2J6QW47_HYAVF|nr:glycoside hydrolase family 88 protein [Hyaloscypha variabilis F]